MTAYEAAGEEYLRLYYQLGVWKRQRYRGVRIPKAPPDLWNYQEIFSERRIDWVVETGTRHGGSALYFADLLELNGQRGKVLTVDVVRTDLQVDAVLEAWARILQRVPQSRLRLVSVEEGAVRPHLLQRLAHFGVGPTRIELHGRVGQDVRDFETCLLGAWRESAPN